MRARWRTWATLALLVVLMAPAVTSENGVPLTSYDMYATPRSPEMTFVVPVGLRANGQVAELSPRTIAASSDPLIVESYLRSEVNAGRQGALCDAVAGRIENGDITSVEIRLEIYRANNFATDSRALGSQVLASCDVP